MIARAVGLLHAPRAACFADHTSRYVTPSDCHVSPGYQPYFPDLSHP